jgi:hypothetical protein
MINNWSKFNESNSEEFGKDKCREIIYYLSEDYRSNNSIGDKFFEIVDTDAYIQYESGYLEIEKLVDMLYDFSNSNEDKKVELNKLYDDIRNLDGCYPTIEDLHEYFLNFFIDEYDFNFYIFGDGRGKGVKLTLNHRISNKDLEYYLGFSDLVNRCYKYWKDYMNYDFDIREYNFENYLSNKYLTIKFIFKR